MIKYIVHDSSDTDVVLGVIKTDGSPSMLFKARRLVIDRLGNDCYNIDDIIAQARILYPKYNFNFDYKLKDYKINKDIVL